MTLQSTIQEKSESQTASKQNTMRESAISKLTEVELSSVNELGFIDKGTGKHQSNAVYGTDGICPCECSVQHKEPYKILEQLNENNTDR